jgi:hypothetical protein
VAILGVLLDGNSALAAAVREIDSMATTALK